MERLHTIIMERLHLIFYLIINYIVIHNYNNMERLYTCIRITISNINTTLIIVTIIVTIIISMPGACLLLNY